MAIPTRRPVRKAEPSRRVNRRRMPFDIASPMRAPAIDAATTIAAGRPKQYRPHASAGIRANAVPQISEALVRLSKAKGALPMLKAFPRFI
jgi:hypothetical protein